LRGVFPAAGRRKLDDLCEFFAVDSRLRRNFHGALLDASLTAEVLQAMLCCLPDGDGII
jgi:DNA polymerase III epsilon subunit-like protein